MNPLKKKELGKIKLWRLKNDTIKKAVSDQVQKITATPKSSDDWSKDIFLVVAKFCGISEEVQRHRTA